MTENRQITKEEAFEKALSLLGPADDPNHPWTLVEFRAGWIVRFTNPEHLGGHTVVIEKDGTILRFPLNIRPLRIILHYKSVRSQGHQEN